MNALDTKLTKTLSEIRKLDSDASLKLSSVGDEWMAVIMFPASFTQVVECADTPSEAILKAWHSAVGSEMPPF